MECKICGKNFQEKGLGYHIKTKHNIEIKDYLKKHYNIPYSAIYWREISLRDISIILNIRKQFPNFNCDLDLFQYLYDKHKNYKDLNKEFNHDIGKICICLGVKIDKSLSEEHKKNVSLGRIGQKLSEKHKEKIKNSYHNLSKSKKEEISKKISQKLKGHHHTRESITKMIQNKSNQKHSFRGNGGIREDIGHFVRSSWEANYARILKYLNVDYSFEPEIIWLKRNDGSEISYRPDFKINDVYVEVKGFWWDDALEKLKLLREQYPNLKLVIIDNDKYYRLMKVYKSKIGNWE